MRIIACCRILLLCLAAHGQPVAFRQNDLAFERDPATDDARVVRLPARSQVWQGSLPARHHRNVFRRFRQQEVQDYQIIRHTLKFTLTVEGRRLYCSFVRKPIQPIRAVKCQGCRVESYTAARSGKKIQQQVININW